MKRTTIGLVIASSMLLLGATKPAPDLTEDQVKAKVEAAGYTDVSNIRREGKHFDATAMKDGKKVDLDIGAKTGKVTPEHHAAKKSAAKKS